MKKRLISTCLAFSLCAAMPALAQMDGNHPMPDHQGMPGMMPPGGPMGMPDHPPGPGDRAVMGERMFKKIDANGDGVITRAEHEAYTKKMFDDVDTNHDDKLTLEEFKSFHTRQMEKMRIMKGMPPAEEEPKADKK